jgi:hypothetical protein
MPRCQGSSVASRFRISRRAQIFLATRFKALSLQTTTGGSILKSNPAQAQPLGVPRRPEAQSRCWLFAVLGYSGCLGIRCGYAQTLHHASVLVYGVFLHGNDIYTSSFQLHPLHYTNRMTRCGTDISLLHRANVSCPSAAMGFSRGRISRLYQALASRLPASESLRVSPWCSCDAHHWLCNTQATTLL